MPFLSPLKLLTFIDKHRKIPSVCIHRDPLCSISFKRQKSLVRRCTRKSVSGSNVNKLGSTVVVMRPHCGSISAIKGNEGKQKDRLPALSTFYLLHVFACILCNTTKYFYAQWNPKTLFKRSRPPCIWFFSSLWIEYKPRDDMILVHMGFHKKTIMCKRKEIHQRIDSFINLGIWEFLVNFFNFNTKHPVNTDKKN